MPAMSKKERANFLYQVLCVQSKSRQTEAMVAFVTQEAVDQGYALREDNGNLYITKGEAELYPCFVAHTDTVHPIIDTFSVHHIDGAVFGWNRAESRMHGIGGDDKVGVYLALQLLRELPFGKAALFRDEEIGCQGAKEADLTFFDDCAFAIEADRRGIEDVVTKASSVDLCSDVFKEALKPIMETHRRKEELHGLSTDVAELKRKGLGICALNLSCGYWYPHGKDEVVIIRDVMNTLRLMHVLTHELGHQRWEHVYEPPKVVVYTPAKVYGLPPKDKWKEKFEETKTQDEGAMTIHGGWYSGGGELIEDAMADRGNWWRDAATRNKALKEEAAKYNGKLEYFSAWRFEQAIPQVGDLEVAQERASINDRLDNERRKQKRYIPPPYTETDGEMTKVDYAIAEALCPECGEFDLTVNYDGVGARNMKKDCKLMVYCWTCRADWFDVEEVLSGRAYQLSAPDIVDLRKHLEEDKKSGKLALVTPTEEVAM